MDVRNYYHNTRMLPNWGFQGRRSVVKESRDSQQMLQHWVENEGEWPDGVVNAEVYTA